MTYNESSTDHIPTSPEVRDHIDTLYKSKGEAARHDEISARIDAAMNPVDRMYDAWLNQVVEKNPDMDDQTLGQLVAGIVNQHKAPAIFATANTHRGANTNRAYAALRLEPDQKLGAASIRVVRRPSVAEDITKHPLKFTVELDPAAITISGPPADEDTVGEAIFTDFNQYGGGKPVPDFLYDGDLDRGEGGWQANAALLEGLVEQQFAHVGIPQDWETRQS